MTRFIIITFFLFASMPILFAQMEGEQTGAPYFELEDSSEQFFLTNHKVSVQIVGTIADVIITQEYLNKGEQPVNANYLFPAGTKAAIYAMEMRLKDRIVYAKIMEKEEAKKTFDEAQEEGLTAGLVEQFRPNVFQTSLANIPAGEKVQVVLKYSEFISAEASLYEFVVPHAVGPRYLSQENRSKKYFPLMKPKPNLDFGFEVDVKLNPGVEIKKISSPSHEKSIIKQNGKTAFIQMDKSFKPERPTDFILNYRLRGESIQNGLLLYEGEEENYFLMMMQPPGRVIPKKLPPREYVFIMDVSGSMHGFPLDVSKEMIFSLLETLRPEDSFNVLFFSGGNTWLAPQSLMASEGNISKAKTYLTEIKSSGGTELFPALKKAMAVKRDKNNATVFAIFTDGQVSIEDEAFAYIKNHISKANFFAFGIGSGVNRHLIESVAEAGKGEVFVAETAGEAKKIASKFKDYIASPVLTNINIKYEGFEAYDYTPSKIYDLFAQRPIVVFGKYKKVSDCIDGQGEGTITLTGNYFRNEYESSLNLCDYTPDPNNKSLELLWARHKVKELDQTYAMTTSEEVKSEITSLGLKYSLLTNYTSFVAVDNQGQSQNKPQRKQQTPEEFDDAYWESLFNYSSGANLQNVIVSAYKIPLIDQDNTTTGQTVTSREIQNNTSKNINGIAAITPGVGSVDEGGGLTVRGSRESATDYYIDGVRTSASMIPVSEMEQVQILTGGVPASIGDAGFAPFVDNQVDYGYRTQPRRPISIGKLKHIPFLTLDENMTELYGSVEKTFQEYFEDSWIEIKENKEDIDLVSFQIDLIIQKDGQVIVQKFSKKVDQELAEKIEKLIENMPKWSPGIFNGEVVDTALSIEIRI